MGSLDAIEIAAAEAFRNITRDYACKLASKYAESYQFAKRIDERCKNNGKKDHREGPDREAHSGSGPGESESSRGSGPGQ